MSNIQNNNTNTNDTDTKTNNNTNNRINDILSEIGLLNCSKITTETTKTEKTEETNEDKFFTVKRKPQKNKEKNKNIQNENEIIKLDKNIIINNVEAHAIFDKYKPQSVFLYGSFATNNFNNMSDINLLIMWNSDQKNMIDNSYELMAPELTKIFKRKISILPMILKKNGYLNMENNFLTNLYADSIYMYGDKYKENIFSCTFYKNKLTDV